MRVLYVYDGVNGGISECAEYLSKASRECSDLHVRKFRTHGAMAMSLLSFPTRVVYFIFLVFFGKFDYCHINVASRGSTVRKYLYSRICKLLRQKYVIHLHGAHYREFYTSLPKAAQILVRNLFQDARFVLTLGEVWRQFVINDISVRPANVFVLKNAIEGPVATQLKTSLSPARIVFLGRLGPRKGIGELLRALALRQADGIDWHLDVCGDGHSESYRALVNQLGISDRVSFHGWLDRARVRELLERAHIFALPSHAENLPLALLEAMAFNVCPIVTPVGAMKEVITDGENGLLVQVGDVDGLSFALHRLFFNNPLIAKLASAARQTFLQDHEIAEYTRKLKKIYEDNI